MFACAVGLLLISMGILLARAFFEQSEAYYGPLGKGAMRVGILPSGGDASGLIIDDMEDIEETLALPIAYTGVARLGLVRENASTQADVYGVGGNFFQFHHFPFVDGTSFMDGLEYDPMMVIDDVTAWNLFGAVEVSGMKLEIGDTEFTVTGVFKSEESMIGEMTSTDIRRVYIPIGALEQIQPEIRIRSLEAAFEDTTLPGEREKALTDALNSVGKTSNDFRIVDYRIKSAMLPQAQDALAFLAGLIALSRLAARMWEYAFPRVKAYFTKEALSPKRLRKHRQTQAVQLLGALVVLGAGVAALMLLTEWELYIPAQYMPAELIDVKFFYNLFVDGFRDSLGAAGYVPLWWETATEAASRMIDSLTLWALFGFAAATPALALIGRKARDRGFRALEAVIACILVMALTEGIAAMLGAQPVFPVKHMALICFYCFASVALIRPERVSYYDNGLVSQPIAEESDVEIGGVGAEQIAFEDELM